MKTSELMICDWVTVIQDDGAGVNKQWSDNDYIETNAEYCEPIPITEEILTLNGFKDGILHTEHVDKVVNLVNSKIVNEDGICMWYLSIPSWTRLPIRYVHELQRVLRCCGLFDLADNFKVTADGVKAHTSAQNNMKASELMIGDWVRVKPHKGYYEGITQVLGIPDRSTLKHNGHVDVELRYFDEIEDCDSYEVEDCEDRHIEPITLTEEILRANGFIDENATNGISFRWYVLQTNQEYGDVWGRTNHTITVAWRECNSDVYIERPYGTDMQQKVIVADIRYIHELQHALRLCGLTNLADNFKVTADGVKTNASAQR